MDAMLGLVVVAIGLLMVVIAFFDRGTEEAVHRLLCRGGSGFVGLLYFVKSEMRGFQMRRRITDIQRQQQVISRRFRSA